VCRSTGLGDHSPHLIGGNSAQRGGTHTALGSETVSVLRRHQEAQLVEKAMAGDAYRDQDLVFCDELGDPISPTRLTAWFGKGRKAAGIPIGTTHTLRDTHITIALTEGMPLHIVAKGGG
jgi:integrase